MALRPGYKQTELGVIPEDWEVRSLKRISPSQSVGVVINPSSYFDERGTVPMLVGSNIAPNRIHWDSAQRISEGSNAALPASRLAAGDLITVRVGAPGVTAVVPPELDGCNCASVMIVRQHPRFASPWLCHVMNSKVGLEQVRHVQYGTAQEQFNIGDAVNFLFPVPPRSEQDAIAEALNDADALIESSVRLIMKKRAVRHGAMQDLFTSKKRLPGFSDEWQSEAFRALYSKVLAKSPLSSGDGQEHGDYPLFVSGGEPKRTDIALYRSTEALVFSDGGVFSARYVTGDFSVTDHCYVLTLQPRVNMQFVGAWFGLNAQTMDRLTFKGSGLRNLDKSALHHIEVPQPHLDEQTAIASLLGDMDAEIAALEAQLSKARQVKQGMIQELLTGRIRLV